MGKATDMTGIQFRMLNTKRGPAVWSPRAQCDKKAYQFRMKWICEREPLLDIQQGQTCRILQTDGLATGVETTLGVQYHGTTVIITTGTFLRGLMHVGNNQQQGGRSGEAAANGLSASLQEVGLKLGRLKTGTPPRLLKRSIDFSKTQPQPGDEKISYFTFWHDDLFHVEHSSTIKGGAFQAKRKYPPGSMLDFINGQLDCFITFTTEKTAEIIRENITKSPMYSGIIEGVGPRYCPSIEDKIIKFPEKKRQQVFLEPEGVATDEIYVNGFSTCLPYEVQVGLIRTIVGCERAEIYRPAYAVEYDFSFPTQLFASLETKTCQNLYLAGQINGTSGYEEAAAQGLMAGINAARRVRRMEPIILGRNQAYIGVLIDDLVTSGTTEPYRMFTSRAEHRLMLRQDNADMRLSKLGYETGLLKEHCYKNFLEKERAIKSELCRVTSTRFQSDILAQLLKRPNVFYKDLPIKDENLPECVTDQIEIMIKYEGYIKRQEIENRRVKSFHCKNIPTLFDYLSVPSLSMEARQKLNNIRPATVGQASRISGVTPSDIGVLLVSLKRAEFIGSAKECGAKETATVSHFNGQPQLPGRCLSSLVNSTECVVVPPHQAESRVPDQAAFGEPPV